MRTMGLLVCVIGLSFGQSSSHPTFDVSAVRMYPARSTVASGVQGFQKSPDGLRAIHVALRGCLQWAYSTSTVPPGLRMRATILRPKLRDPFQTQR